jgi:hypothetical protein
VKGLHHRKVKAERPKGRQERKSAETGWGARRMEQKAKSMADVAR